MKIRGERECKDCGSWWSYYETGAVACPECGSMQSVGVDDRTEHTASAVTLDLTDPRGRVDDVPLADLADDVESRCGEYVRRVGFVDAGQLRELDDTYLGAAELRHVAAELARSMRVTDDEEYYFLELLRGVDAGERPLPTAVPDSLHAPRGLAAAAAVDAYRSDVRRYLDEHPDPAVRRLLGRVDEHRKRVDALDGDVPPQEAESLVDAARAIGRSLARDDETALAEARNRLDSLAALE
jgi:uncharacterized Zn finger protein (UPF0148 family)